MSSDAVSWAFDQDLKTSEKFVLVAIAEHANPSGVCFPGQQRLSAMTGYEASTVVRALKRLEADGVLARTERRRPDNFRTSDWIVLAPRRPDTERLPLKPAPSQEHYPESVLALFGPEDPPSASSGSLPDEPRPTSPGSSSASHLDLSTQPHLAQIQGFKEEPSVMEPSVGTNPPSAPPTGGQQTEMGQEDWDRFAQRLRSVVEEDQFAMWLAELRPVSVGEQLVLAAPDKKARWIKNRFSMVLAAAAEKPVEIVLANGEPIPERAPGRPRRRRRAA